METIVKCRDCDKPVKECECMDDCGECHYCIALNAIFYPSNLAFEFPFEVQSVVGEQFGFVRRLIPPDHS